MINDKQIDALIAALTQYSGETFDTMNESLWRLGYLLEPHTETIKQLKAERDALRGVAEDCLLWFKRNTDYPYSDVQPDAFKILVKLEKALEKGGKE